MRKFKPQVAVLILALLAQSAVSIFAYDEKTGTGVGAAAVMEIPTFNNEFDIAKAASISHHGHINRHSHRRSGARKHRREGHVMYHSGKNSKSYSDHKSHSSHKNISIAALEAMIAKLTASLQTAQKDYADARNQNADLKAKNAELLAKINDAEEKLKLIPVLERKLKEAEKLIYELKAKLGSDDQDSMSWKSKLEFAASKIAEYEETIKKLKAYIAELKAKNSDDSEARKQLAQALAKVEELRHALDAANERLRYFASLQHKYRLPSQVEKSRKEHSHKSASNKQNNNEFRTIQIKPTIINGMTRDGKTTVVVGEELTQ